jgi:O6-methylguanine-DNA--protein-cysteine methyltransferase
MGAATPQVNKNTVEDLVEREEDRSSVADVRRTIIRMFNELKEELKVDIQKQLNEFQKKWIKKLRRHRNN